MSKPIIAVDIDETLMPHFEDLIKWYNSKFGTELTEFDNHPTDPGNWGTDDVTVAIKRVHQFYETSMFLESKPFAEARQTLNRVQEKYELIVVTARDSIIEAATQDWLKVHFEDLFSEVHFTYHFSLEGKKRTKVEVLKDRGVTYLIDDSLEHCFAAAEAGISTVLFGNYAWNQADSIPNNMTRCANWPAVEKYFNDQAQ